jgi:hypothetical protein
MAKTKDIIEGLQILSKYMNPNGYDVGAEHDILYVYVEGPKPSGEDQLKLDKLGWHVDSDSGNWACFV